MQAISDKGVVSGVLRVPRTDARTDRQAVDRLAPPFKQRPDEYLSDSRNDVLEAICHWIETSNTRFFWLYGAAGVGKSTMAHRLVDILGEVGMLATYFFFKRYDGDQADPTAVIKNMAYELASLYPELIPTIAAATRKQRPSDRQLVTSVFEDFIFLPLCQGCHPGPMVIVFDAVDECQEQEALLKSLVKATISLPTNIKLLITNRISPDISDLAAKVYRLQPASDLIIAALFKDRLGRLAGFDVTEDQISRLVELSSGQQ